jgi:diguanylate cyclase (GGDEF)-like protein
MRHFFRICGLCLLLCACWCQAAPRELAGTWLRVPDGWSYRGEHDLRGAGLEVVGSVSRSGGTFWRQADFEIDTAGRYVLDFSNTSIIGHFRHIVLDAGGNVLVEVQGGIRTNEKAQFSLRHGREIELPAGRYRLLTELDSPFFLAQPVPYLDTLVHYRSAIAPGNALALICMGMLLGLMIYYGALAAVRWRQAELMYAGFILGNFLFNGMALQIFPQLLGIHWIYLVSIPILFSNCAYVLFVTSLLEIRPEAHPRLYRTGRLILAALVALVVGAAILPHWSLEIDRFGVGLFLSYGLAAAIVRMREGSASARLYLYAILAFFVLGMATITASSLEGIYTLYIEHMGLLSVSIEVVLLSLVLAHQFAELYRDKESALLSLGYSMQIARTDALTGLPNRLVLDSNLAKLPSRGSLTFIDMDGLKFYNDQYGHERGDALLRAFAKYVSSRLAEDSDAHAIAYRLGGDEFAITCESGDLILIERAIANAVADMRQEGFDLAGASFGSVHVYENPTRNQLKQIADARMYRDKVRRKSEAAERAATGQFPMSTPPRYSRKYGTKETQS